MSNIRAVAGYLQETVVPQAIFWRPIHYFATQISEAEDDLDIFQSASYCIGNLHRFDLRRYQGHPDETVTLYLPINVEALSEILEVVRLILYTMQMPETAIAWRRGWDFKYGSLERRANDRLREPEARVLALKIAALTPTRFASTDFLKSNVPDYYPLSRIDNAPSTSRKRERRWQQIVGNVISHQSTSRGPFKQGYALRTGDGLALTDLGLSYLNNMGFSV